MIIEFMNDTETEWPSESYYIDEIRGEMYEKFIAVIRYADQRRMAYYLTENIKSIII